MSFNWVAPEDHTNRPIYKPVNNLGVIKGHLDNDTPRVLQELVPTLITIWNLVVDV